ncbi:MAG: hypothetical protein U5K79_01865 [Cyclobacteriaceae bacterium]|nr:hypothetical protein [Cyclobacteriaceae bacterium]
MTKLLIKFDSKQDLSPSIGATTNAVFNEADGIMVRSQVSGTTPCSIPMAFVY